MKAVKTIMTALTALLVIVIGKTDNVNNKWAFILIMIFQYKGSCKNLLSVRIIFIFVQLIWLKTLVLVENFWSMNILNICQQIIFVVKTGAKVILVPTLIL